MRRGWHADRKQLLMLLLGLIVGVEFLENGMFVFAASHIVGGMDAAPREFAQVQAAYAIGSMTMIVLQQWLSRHFGYRRYLSAALGLFMLGGLACAGAQTLPMLTLARLLQGFGGGALFTSCRVLVPMLFGPRDRPRALRDFMLVAFALPIAAPLLSAVLVEHLSWRWVFLAALPLAALAIAGAWLLLPDEVGRGGEPVRWAAAPLLVFAAAVTLVQMGLAQARFEVFAHPARLAATALAGVGLLAWFFAHQVRHEAPMVRLRELGHPVYLAGLGLYFVHYCLAGASSYVFPIFAERGLGIALTTAGWLNSFSSAVTLAAAYVYIKRGARLPRKKPLMVAGALALALAAWLFATMPPDAPAEALLLALAAKGVFGALLVLPVAGLTFRDLGEERFAHGYQSKNLMRQVAGTFASALAAITLQDRQFANYEQIASHIDGAGPSAGNWLEGIASTLTAQGVSAGEAHHAALAALSRMVDQQALLLSCEDLYRLLAALALAAAIVILMQRRLK